MSKVIDKLNELNIKLPAAAKAAANYAPYVASGNQIHVAGQIPFEDGSLENNIGKVGENFTTEQAYNIAKICAVNLVAQVNGATNGDLDSLKCVKLGVFVNCTENFTEQSLVANGASDLIGSVFGENGVHARSAVGVSSLPFGVAVEVDAIFEII